MSLNNKRVTALIKVALMAGVIGAAVVVGLGAFPSSCTKEVEAQAGTPEPHIDYILLNGSLASSVTVTLLDSVLVEVQATNVGAGAGYRGRIYISFPELDSYNDVDFVELVDLWTSSGDDDLEYIVHRPGDPDHQIYYACGSHSVRPAEDVLITGYAPSDWEPGEKLSLKLKVTPPKPGTFTVYVRSETADAASGGSYYYEPTSTAYTDQQCRYAYRRAVEVGPLPYAQYLPVVLKEYDSPLFLRAVHLQAWSCSEPTRCDRKLDCLEQAGVTMLYYKVYYGQGFYPSEFFPHRSFDSLAYLVPEAHARGMQVYATLPVASMGWPEHSRWNARRNHPDIDDNWLDFEVPEARSYVADVAEEIVTNYDVDGIMLDYIRWRSSWYLTVDVSADDVSKTVEGVYDRINSVRPTTLAASVYKDRKTARYARQMWSTWLDDGYINYVVPMAYVDDRELHALVDDWEDSGHFPQRIAPCLSLASFGSTTRPKDARDVVRQVDMCYDAGATGIALWDDRYLCKNPDLIEVLDEGGW
jgi:hypothetical protein